MGEIFSWLSLPDGRGYLFPVNSTHAMVGGLSIYNARGRKAKIAKGLLKLGFQMGLGKLLLSKWRIGNSLNLVDSENFSTLFDFLKYIFNRSDLTFAISMGTPGAQRKPVIQIMTINGKILGYAKVGWNEATYMLVRNEADVLRKYCVVSTGFHVPKVIYSGEWQRKFLCVQSAPDLKTTPSPNILNWQYLEALKDLSKIHLDRNEIEKSAFWTKLLGRIGRVKSAYYRHVLQTGIRYIEEELSDYSIPFHWSHGDFTPWNTYRVGGKLYLFDWEYASPESPAGYDLFHFITQTMWLLERETPGKIYIKVMNLMEDAAIKGYWKSLRLEEGIVRLLFLLYLLDRLAFYASEESEYFWKLRHFAILVNLCVHSEGAL